jgi:glycosyltransferase involved in cell wall biosynthesis
MNKEKDFLNLSVIIPIFKATDSIKLLISLFLSQKIKPKEIILLDSGSNFKITKYFEEISNNLKIVIYKKISFSHPGTARNIGIKMSKSDYVTFFDINTLPTFDWLKKSYERVKKDNLNVLFGKRVTLDNTFIKKIIKYSTYGNSSYISLTGTIINKSFLIKNNFFFMDTRAGEDIEWIKRVRVEDYHLNQYIILYNGLSGDIIFNLKKWFIYSISYSKILKDVNHQKKIYFFALIYSMLAIFLLEDYLLLFFFSINFLIYLIYFSFLRPIQSNVSFKDLFPFNWILIVFIRILFDISKTPGLIIGYIRSILKI